MKLKANFVLRQVADTWVVLPLADATLNFNGMLTLNDSGAMLWKVLEQGGTLDALADALTSAFDVSREMALADAEEFVKKLFDAGCIEMK